MYVTKDFGSKMFVELSMAKLIYCWLALNFKKHIQLENKTIKKSLAL